MTEREKILLRSKYGHNKILFLIHLVGRYIKELYRPNIATRKPLILGNGNVVSFVPKGVQIEIYGDNNKVEIDPSVTKWDGHIGLGDAETPVYNCHISIGKNAHSNGVNIIVMEDNTSVTIGKNCMFSWGIYLFASDTHTIYDAKTKNY